MITCATCPFARHIDGDRYECTATHNHHNSVVRGHWTATNDCDEALAEQFEVRTDENPEALFKFVVVHNQRPQTLHQDWVLGMGDTEEEAWEDSAANWSDPKFRMQALAY